jgi:hypothetical protein
VRGAAKILEQSNADRATVAQRLRCIRTAAAADEVLSILSNNAILWRDWNIERPSEGSATHFIKKKIQR